MLLFGGKKMPELGRSLGQSIREFKKASAEFESELKRATDDEKPALHAPEPAPETKPAAVLPAKEPAEPGHSSPATSK
jgi:sec-independent protein translocase protein TatA